MRCLKILLLYNNIIILILDEIEIEIKSKIYITIVTINKEVFGFIKMTTRMTEV